MHSICTTQWLKKLSIFILANLCLFKLVACDKNIIGPIGAPNNVIFNGERGCVTGDFSGSITVNPGGELRICGQYIFSGSINISRGAKVVLTSGSSIGVNGSMTFNDDQSLEFLGDPSCNAEIYAVSFNSCFVTWGASPGLSGRFCNSNNVYLQGFTFIWGPSTIGNARFGRAPTLCAGGGFFPCEVVLPINTVAFDAQHLGQAAYLEWTSSTEINNDYYTVERSTQGLEWEGIDTLHVISNSTTPNTYHYIDQAPYTAGTYYRIRQTDLDGVSTVTATKYVSGISDAANFLVFPNPSRGKFSLSLAQDHHFEAYKVIDQVGSIVLTGTIHTSSSQEIDMTKLDNGLYTLLISGQDAVVSQRVIVADN
jgi:hypothetical protein